MYRKILVSGVTAAAIIGAGATALAVTGSDPTPGTPSSTSSPKDHAKSKNHSGKNGKAKLLRRAAHAQIVTKGKDGFVTHDLINGTVTSVSATSITVKAADNKSETFTVTKDTKVRARTNGKGADSSISKVLTGDHIVVVGTGTSTLTAKHLIDLGKK